MVARVCTCTSEFGMVEDIVQAVGEAQGVLRARFRRAAAYRHATDYLQGLMAEVERKNGWQLAEQS